MDPVGSQERAYVHGAGKGAVGADAPARFTTRGEPDRGGPETRLWAYCRELCGPEACDRAVAAILRALEAGPATIAEDELLRITRATAARFTAPATDAYSCAETPVRLAAWASDELDPGERHELREHLAACLPCHAIKVRMDRAERGFATLSSGRTAAREPRFVARDGAAGADLSSPAGADGGLRTELGAGRATAAVRGYCGELCGPIGSGRAVAESVAAAGIEAGFATVANDDLLRLTRVAAAKQALIDADEQLARENPSAPRDAECAMTPALLASAANGELEPVAQLELERHLERCLVCQASRIKLDRAERAFATIASAAAGTEREYATRPGVANGAADAATAAAGATPGAPRPRTGSGGPASSPGLRARRRLAVLGALVLAAAAAAAVLAAGGAFSTTSAPPAVPAAAHPAPARPAPAPATGAATAAVSHQAAAKPKATPARHRAPATNHRAARAHRTAQPKHAAAPAPAAKSAPASAPGHRPKPSRAPASAPAASNPASSPAPNTSTPSVTPQGTNLPAQSAPTQGIGSSGG